MHEHSGMYCGISVQAEVCICDIWIDTPWYGDAFHILWYTQSTKVVDEIDCEDIVAET